MQLVCKMSAWIVRYIGSKSGPGIVRKARAIREISLTVQVPDFNAKSHITNDAKHATKHMEIKSILPRVKTYNYQTK